MCCVSALVLPHFCPLLTPSLLPSLTHSLPPSVIEEQGVRLKLTVTDTPGFGDQVNNDKCWEPIAEFVNEQFDRYLNEEVSINRKKVIPDTRVHCCLYFIPPTGHR